MSKVTKAVGAVVAIGLAAFTGGLSLAGAGSLFLAQSAVLLGKLGTYGLRVRDRHGCEWIAS